MQIYLFISPLLPLSSSSAGLYSSLISESLFLFPSFYTKSMSLCIMLRTLGVLVQSPSSEDALFQHQVLLMQVSESLSMPPSFPILRFNWSGVDHLQPVAMLLYNPTNALVPINLSGFKFLHRRS